MLMHYLHVQALLLMRVDTLLDSSKQDIEQLLAMTQQATARFWKNYLQMLIILSAINNLKRHCYQPQTL